MSPETTDTTNTAPPAPTLADRIKTADANLHTWYQNLILAWQSLKKTTPPPPADNQAVLDAMTTFESHLLGMETANLDTAALDAA